MTNSPEQQLRDGLAALRAGNAEQAEELLSRVTDAGDAAASTWLALAFARATRGAAETALAAVNEALALEPRNMRALLFKGDHLDRMGKSRPALNFYQGAIRVAASLPRDQIPQDVMQGLARAQAMLERSSADYEQFLFDNLASDGFDGREHPRIMETLQIACGRKPVQLQQPTRLYFPGLPQRAFYEREEFDWVAQVEAHTAAIRDELQALTTAEHFRPYLEADDTRPDLNDRGNLGSMDWSACYVWRAGTLVSDISERCPSVASALSEVPLCRIPGQTPSVLFSRLAPDSTIAPHHGLVNTRLICHLPLVVPAGCGELRVGNYQRGWREGELLIFDDSVEHEAWNDSDRARTVLLFDIWRPELTREERHWVTRILKMVTAYGEE
ncbi:MAG: aspartyl/asparaginyl beta-hydroxylase domain-containing protein [Chromatocurvus sp.]